MAIRVSGGGKRRIVAAAVAHGRLDAAMHHYRRLERDWQAWMRQHPISVEVRLSALTLEADLVARVPEPVDQSLTGLAKACLGEVRAALDNMVVAAGCEAPDAARQSEVGGFAGGEVAECCNQIALPPAGDVLVEGSCSW